MVVMRHAASGAPAISLAGSSKRMSSTPATAGTNIRRRRCWTCTPSARGWGAWKGCTSASSATSPTAAWRARTSSACRRWGRRCRVCGPATMIPREIEKLGVDVVPPHRRRPADGGRAERPAHPAGTGRRTALPVASGNTTTSTASPAQRLEKAGRAITILHPGADQPRRGDLGRRGGQRALGHPAAGAERRRRPHGGPVPAVHQRN